MENYPISSEITFKVTKIKETIDKIIMSNIDYTARVKILTDVRFENQVREENEKNLALQYNEGY